MGLQNTTASCMRAIRRFLCNNIMPPKRRFCKTIEKYIENPQIIFCSVFQNRRLGIIKDGLTKHNQHARCMRAIRRFLCNNIARMGNKHAKFSVMILMKRPNNCAMSRPLLKDVSWNAWVHKFTEMCKVYGPQTKILDG